MTGPVVRFHDVTAGYGFVRKRDVLRRVSVEFSPGRVTGLMGRNGAGKTTLIRLALGFVSARRGRVDIDLMAPSPYREEFGIGFLSEHTALPGGWTLDEFLRYGRSRCRAPDGVDVECVQQDIVDDLELGAERRKLLSGLSKGTARRAALAWALTGAPALVILDEPAGGLDPRSRMGLRKVTAGCAKRGATVIVSSHEVDELVRMCDEVRVVQQGSVSDPIAGEDLRTDVLEGIVGAAPTDRPA